MSTPDEQTPDPMLSASPSETPQPESDTPPSDLSPPPGFPRRALLRAGWAIPAIVALDAVLPSAAGAVFANSGGFANFPGGFGNTFDNVFRNAP